MEPSQLVGGAEECSSCESGWTMYLASPMHDDDEAEVEDEDGEGDADDATEDDHCAAAGDGGNDDDSLASDASSGPPHRSLSHKSNAGGAVMPKEDDGDEEDDRVEDEVRKVSGHSWKKGHKNVEKDRDDDSGAAVSHMADGAASLFYSSDK